MYHVRYKITNENPFLPNGDMCLAIYLKLNFDNKLEKVHLLLSTCSNTVRWGPYNGGKLPKVRSRYYP